jgi:hypothetical protein
MCDGWSEGVLSMRVGERAVLTCGGETGYGEEGRPDWNIPPNAHVVFTLTLVAVSDELAPPPEQDPDAGLNAYLDKLRASTQSAKLVKQIRGHNVGGHLRVAEGEQNRGVAQVARARHSALQKGSW